LPKTCFRPCIGQRFAGREPGLFGGHVQGGDARAACAGNCKDERPIRIDGLVGADDRLRGEKTQDRPAWQPD
jgi:hypothetical protein